ncbi:MAG: DNA polymerase domain-containing protein, partial [Candidatus Aenigmarchaeota archaeon]|nr:DNA polymerase domain-containing protein [Candidatus Aenigmarchaeota archaeon]
KTKNWVKKLLLRLGIVGSLHSQGIYLIRCSDNIQRIKQFILPMMKKNEKVECFLSSIKTDKRGNLDILPPLAGKLLKKIRKEKNISTYSFKNTPHSTIYYYESGMYKIQRDKFLEIVEELKNRFCINVKELEEISNSEIFWDKVVKVEESETSSVYDLTTSSGNFVANDVIVHNSDMFDFQILQQRADELKVKLFLSRDGSYLKFARRARISAARLSGRVHIDIFNFINNVLSPTLQTETLTLDAVSAELLGDEKIEMEFEEILKAWRKKRDLAKLAEYCLKDSELTLRLSKLLLPQIFEICKIVGQLPFDVSRMTYGQLVEWYLTKKAFTLNEIILNQPKFEEIQKRRLTTYVGGFVKEPIGGIHENIAVVDFRSLYPSIIATFNISPETIDCEHVECKKEKIPESNHWFCKKKKGFFSVVVKELIEKRIEVKEKMKKLREGTEGYRKFFNQQYALKILANATYGYTGYPGSKWYSKKCAESITAYGRYFVKKIIELAEKSGFTVVYADTDSCFIKL